MSIEVLGIAQVKPLAGMPPDQFQRIVNQVLSRAAKGQNHRSTGNMNVSDLAARYMAMATQSRPLSPAEIAKLGRNRPADRVVARYSGPQDAVRSTFEKARRISK